MNLVVKGHRIDPRQAEAYHKSTTWRRMLNKSNKLKKRAERTWRMRRDKGKAAGEGDGPIAVLEKTVGEIGWSWDEFEKFGRKDRIPLPFLTQETSWWGHELREDLRNMIWTKDTETLKRRSFKGSEVGVDHAATAELYREVVSNRGKAAKARWPTEGEEEDLEEDDYGRPGKGQPKLAEKDRAILRTSVENRRKAMGCRTQKHTHLPALQHGSPRNG